MKMQIHFSGGRRVDASFKGFTVHTDQPVRAGGEGAAPAPYAVFLASLGTCAGVFVQAFCEARGLATEGIELLEEIRVNPETGLAGEIRLEVRVPESFPARYHRALVKVTEQCSVKRSLADPPRVWTELSVAPAPVRPATA